MYKGNTFSLKGKKSAVCLLIHGLTASTQEIENLALFLHAKGYSVAAPLLPGHNTDYHELAQLGWQDWYRKVDDTYSRLKEKEIHVIGHSMGAVLGLFLAEKKNVSSLSALVPALLYQNPMVIFTPLLQHIIPFRRKNYTKYYPSRPYSYADIADDEAYKRRIAYKVVSLHALAESLKLIRLVKENLSTITAPALIIHSKKDHTIRPESAALVHRLIGSDKKKLVYLEKSGHIIADDVERKEVFAAIADFIS